MKVVKIILLLVALHAGFYVTQAQTTVAIPVANFRAKLIAMHGISAGTGTNIIVTNISSIETIEVSTNYNTPVEEYISDLTGIEMFTSLTRLDCSNNNLNSLNTSTNTALTHLESSNNNLTALSTSANTALTYFSNNLTSLNISRNTKMTGLHCYNNSLSSLNLRGATALVSLRCFSNSLTSSLDISTNTKLTRLYCYNNSLTSLDLSANTILSTLQCGMNASLECIQVNSTQFSERPLLWKKDATASYSQNCTYTTLGITNTEKEAVNINYNSKTKEIHFLNTSPLSIKEIAVYTVFGQQVKPGIRKKNILLVTLRRVFI